jgi:hypothetical protein
METNLLKENEIDLLAEMAAATAEVMDTQNDFREEEEAAPIYTNDFQDIEEEEEEEESESDNFGLNEMFQDPEDLAELITEGLDSILTFALPLAMEKTISIEDRVSLKQLAQKYRTASKTNSLQMSLDEKDQKIMELYIDLEEYKESLPFTDKEKENFKKRLSKVLTKMNFQVTPESALIYSAAFIMAPRLAPIGISYFKK